MIVQCANCFIDVSPNRDGICPACRQNATLAQPEKQNLVKAEFVDGEKLPDICHVCGKPSSGHIESGVLNERQGIDEVGLFARLLGVLGGGLLLARNVELERKKFALSVQLPVCARHEAMGPIEPLYVDERTVRLAFSVHQALRDAWANQRRR
jgi:hypothetical protein